MELKRVVKYTAIGLGLCFGWVGLHRHFLDTDHAVTMSVLGALGLFFPPLLLAMWVWAMIDVVRMFSADDVEALFPASGTGVEEDE